MSQGPPWPVEGFMSKDSKALGQGKRLYNFRAPASNALSPLAQQLSGTTSNGLSPILQLSGTTSKALSPFLQLSGTTSKAFSPFCNFRARPRKRSPFYNFLARPRKPRTLFTTFGHDLESARTLLTTFGHGPRKCSHPSKFCCSKVETQASRLSGA